MIMVPKSFPRAFARLFKVAGLGLCVGIGVVTGVGVIVGAGIGVGARVVTGVWEAAAVGVSGAGSCEEGDTEQAVENVAIIKSKRSILR